jgi:hypothetical protein
MSLNNKINSDQFLKKHFKVVDDKVAVREYERFGVNQEVVSNYYLSIYTLLNTFKDITQDERIVLQNLLMNKIKSIRGVEVF